MIAVSDLVKRYGSVKAVAGIGFAVKRGEVVGFLGPNGAGKTTTLRILTGSLDASEGQVSVAGYDVVENPAQVRRRVGYLPEQPPLYDELRTDEYLRFVAGLKGVGRRQIGAELDRVVGVCGLKEVRGRLIANLSKGFRQRLGLAQALMGQPEVLLLDEPTIGLDPNQVLEIRALIRSLAERHTIILSTHILPEVVQVCSRVIILHRGRIVADDAIERLVSESRTLEQTFHELTGN